ncbi:hypothetical protein F5X68DRAFT_261619 [Plectosphaerella plurivora]|uniref:Uncharacterized protein n=1 Tax=Plectosphaerella plurivora TaxID=936078 RepID=A0A9P8VD04_9PEZI|nr:hypothetical protein F5X68DRAFT_261619 [Plectosphaerella plurivora]
MAAVADNQDLQLQVLAKKCIRQGDQVVDVPLQQVPLVSVPTHIQYNRETEWKLIKPLNRARGRYTNKSFDQENWSQQLAFYIGVDTISFAPVFSAGLAHHHSIPSQPSYNDDLKIQFKARPYGRTNGRPNTLLDEYMFTEGALGFTKRLASNHAATVARIGPDIIPRNANAPILLAVSKDYLDGAYALRLPRIRKATVTKALFELAVEIQAFLYRDNIHVNEIIVQALWYRIKPRFLNADHSLLDQANYIKVLDLKILSFISMFPHYLRMHELHRLVTYTQPYWFVEATRKAKDTGNPPLFHEVHNPKWLATAASEIYLSGLTDDDWFAAPSAELHRDLGLPDINMIIHPVYPVSNIDTTAIIIPAPWLTPVILKEFSPQQREMLKRAVGSTLAVAKVAGLTNDLVVDDNGMLAIPGLADWPVN